ncbi:Mur ligase family protein [Fonticella tunisiensis]|uniref:Mur ligase-like protein n=1 Tax=Fonticella tunisiensis TaxID=1096341 RepID=A0A4R7KR44_9CLOT|nr:Mur ligase family protein [Fonticella tunisiensis]TDT61073.1 Mur ligase-like protein [Fonticella tunisiensis]
MVTIGILGSRGKSAVAEIIEKELIKVGKGVYIIGTKEDSVKEFMKLFTDQIDYVIIEISREDILGKHLDKIKFDILIITTLKKENEELLQSIQSLIKSIKENGYIIFDSDSIQQINFTCDKVYPITYGLNGKTTVTASSIQEVDGLYFSYCLQRGIYTLTNSIVQSFEKPVKVIGNYDDVYYYLAAFTCLLVIGELRI